MKMKIKQNQFLMPLFILLFQTFQTQAQSYGTALGVRLDGFGVTLQQQVAANSTVEVIAQTAGFGKSDIQFSALFEQHKSLITRGLNFYLGGGLYKLWYDKDKIENAGKANPYGISPIIGLELNLGKLLLSGDVKPNLKLGGDGKGLAWHTGISIRYELHGRYFKNEKWKFWKKK
jgi:hypothetical protein